MFENVDVEYKELDRKKGTLPDSIPKEIIAFANTEGGEIYVGIRNDGHVVGVDDPDDVMTRLSNVAHDTILPDVLPFVQIRTVEMEGRQVVRMTVSVGTERPYYLAREGLKPRGVFVRRGSACIPVSESGIREMILETSGKSYEESRSLDQELSFDTLQREFAARQLELGPAQMKTLGLIGHDGLYTNLALLLSDQCAHTVKVAVFQGNDNAVFRERREFGGSLLRQLEDAYQFLDFYNRTEASFHGLRRSDQRDYPEEAVREALLNSIIHRDYVFSGSTIINVFDDHIEFISLGGLVRGISMEAIFMGASQSRNPRLAAVFYLLGLVESYGTGIRKILRLYEGLSPAPGFFAAEGVFRVELPNRNEGQTKSGNGNSGEVTAAPKQESMKQTILYMATEHGSVTRKEAEEELHVGTTKAFTLLIALCREGKLRQIKSGNQTSYVPVTENT